LIYSYVHVYGSFLLRAHSKTSNNLFNELAFKLVFIILDYKLRTIYAENL